MPLRYFSGYSLILLSRLLSAVVLNATTLVEQFALLVWTPREIDRYSRADWNHLTTVQEYSRLDKWLHETEKSLVEQYFAKRGTLLNLACGAGREAALLARQGLRVTACDWSPRMVAEARRRARDADLPVRFAVADMYNLPYREQAFDYLLLTNVAYSYLFPRYRRLRFLRQAYSMLKPDGVFIISFAEAANDPDAAERLLQRLCVGLRRYAPFNKEYEPGDRFAGTFVHLFQQDDLKQEFEEAKFIIKEWPRKEGCAVLAKA